MRRPAREAARGRVRDSWAFGIECEGLTSDSSPSVLFVHCQRLPPAISGRPQSQTPEHVIIPPSLAVTSRVVGVPPVTPPSGSAVMTARCSVSYPRRACAAFGCWCLLCALLSVTTPSMPNRKLNVGFHPHWLLADRTQQAILP